jgi:hypothetical protein
MKVRLNYFDSYTPREWRRIVKNWEKSGLSPTQYCKENKVVLNTFYTWRKRFNPDSMRGPEDIINKWKALIEGWKTSGMDKREYCRKQGVLHETMDTWNKKLNPPPLRPTPLERWTLLVEEWKTSGLNKCAYCRKKKIDSSAFHKWERKITSSLSDIKKERHSQNEVPEKGEMSSQDPNTEVSMTSIERIEVALPHGHHLCIEGVPMDENVSSWIEYLLAEDSRDSKESRSHYGSK